MTSGGGAQGNGGAVAGTTTQGIAGGPQGIAASSSAGSGGVPNECQRDVTLQAVSLGEPEPFDLVIVADHSSSLAWSREELASGLEDLLSQVQGRSVRVFVLTPTQYGADSEAARMPLTGNAVVTWQDPLTGEAYAPAATTFEQTCTDETGAPIACPDPQGTTPYSARGTWTFRLAEPIAVLDPQMTDAQFEAAQAAVRKAILELGGAGSPNEQPLCTLVRYVTQPANELPQNAMFLIISDEDDTSEPLQLRPSCILRRLRGTTLHGGGARAHPMPRRALASRLRFQVRDHRECRVRSPVR